MEQIATITTTLVLAISQTDYDTKITRRGLMTLKISKRYIAGLALSLSLSAVLSLQGVASAVSLSVLSTDLISASPAGDPGDSFQGNLAMTPDARYVTFISYSTNLVAGTPTNPAAGAFLYDRTTHTMEDVSCDSNNAAGTLSISDDGRFVLYDSQAALYLCDRTTGTSTQISLPTLAFPDNNSRAMSGDANIIVYDGSTDENTPYEQRDSYMYNRTTGTTTQLPAGVVDATVSADGRYIAYRIQHETSPGVSVWSKYRQNIATGAVTAFATSDTGPTGAVLTDDGSHAAYYSQQADGTFNLYFENIATGQSTLIYTGIPSTQYDPVTAIGSLSTDSANRYLSFNSGQQGFIADLSNGQTTLVDSNIYYKGLTMRLSADGSQLAFNSYGRQGELTNGEEYVAHIDVPDTTSPTISAPTMAPKVFHGDGTATVGATTSDAGSGVASGEYYIDTDPGQGQGQALTYDAATGKVGGTAAISGLSHGRHKLFIRSKDVAGNWSAPVSVSFTFI
jgi:hypothetical protein